MNFEQKKFLVCSGCHKQFSLIDIRELRYFGETGRCAECYQKMVQSKDNCFGKMYDPEVLECQRNNGLCPDRMICPLFMEWEADALLQWALEEGII